MKVYIKTWGCQANIADSEQMAGILKEKGYDLVDSEDEAEYIIANTCAVKNKTQSKILDYIKKNKNKKIFVGGCLTKTIDIKDHFSSSKEHRILSPIIRKDEEVGIVAIGEGCLNSCTFCATKLARGSLRSYRIGEVKRNVEFSINQGCKKIYLTSQDNGCYGFDIKTSLPELLNELATIEGEYIIRVGMMNPWHLNKILPSLIESYKSEKIMKFLHIPVQSGSEKILRNMKRIHTVDNFKTAVKKFRENFPRNLFPNSTIATDIIIGYPTETEQDFKETYNLIKEVKPEVINITAFSSRPRTKASKLKQLPSEIIKERLKKITILYNKIKETFINKVY
ncbi:MAG: MiaB-like protein tRNA modifying enzyme [Parcubacteria group bacterium GW2011_GWA1_36_12]|nr:MAG: MiaB-like protein tRNA modifying enzyme [Parcubacteria group bacterium GW2011_GWA1_36_12]